jgi:hypothetical protein
MDGYISTAGEQTMPWGDREAWWLHPLLNHWWNITVVVKFKVIIVNFEIGYFCIQLRLSYSLKHEWSHSWHSIKQTTIGLISARFDYQVIIYLELMMIYLGGGGFLFGFINYQVVFLWHNRKPTYVVP